MPDNVKQQCKINLCKDTDIKPKLDSNSCDNSTQTIENRSKLQQMQMYRYQCQQDQ